MTRLGMVGMIIVTAMVGGCAAKQQPAPPPLRIVHEAAPPAPAGPPPPTAAEILAAQPAEVREAVKEHDKKGEWPSYRTRTYMLYPYGEGPQPVIDCAALRTTDVQLQPGETVTDLAIGDQERWMATPASSGDPRNPVPHLALKPQAPGIETNLTIYTTKHIYHLVLRSRTRAMQEVEFYYPEELLAAMRAADDAAAKAKQETPQEIAIDPPGDSAGSVLKVAAADPSQLNFAYEIDGPNVPWRPLRVFDDHSHVYLEMPASMKSSQAPALLIAAGGGTQMVNYRVRGSYFVVDRLFEKGVLLAGVGRQQDRVVIAYAGGAR
jgi:P-type conjugative transfer protein TrbG